MLSKFSVKKPYTVFVTVLLVIILGVVSFTEMTPDLLPSIELPYAVVVTSYVGASPEEVELTVTKPMEQSLATLNNVESISSTSSENMSMVILEFADDANMDAMGIDIREKLDMVSGYFDDAVGSPMIMKLNPDMMPVMVAAVDVEGMNTIEVSTFVEEEILPLLESTEGVASVQATGLVENKIEVVLNQKKIDVINKKLEASVNEKLEEAEKQLTKAKKEIESGQDSIDQKNNELSSGMSQASQELSKARLEVLKNEIAMANGDAEFTSKENELNQAEFLIKQQEEEFQKKEKELNAGLKQAKDALEQWKGLESFVEEDNKEEYLAKKTELSAIVENLNKAKETLLAAQPQIVGARIQIEEGKTALKEAKEKFNQGKTQLSNGATVIDQKENELNAQKASAESKLEDAKNQLISGEKEINAKIDSFEQSKEEALKAANVNDKITQDMISDILKAQNFTMPAGYIKEEGIDYLVRVGDKIKDVDELKELVLFDLNIEDMEPITLSDVADIAFVDNADETYAKINGNDGIIISFQKQTSYATAVVAENLKHKFDEISDGKQAIHFTPLMDQGIYIEMVIQSVLDNLIMGGILAVIILLIFLKDIKPTFIIACSIPISVVFAIVLMYFSGVTLNIISLSGLAIGVGMLVDNSVVVIENIYRLRSKGVSAVKASVTGAVQVGSAIISSTLTTISVFLPIVFVKGISRDLFTDMALTIGYSLVASLIVALTLVPAMSATMLRNTKEKKHPILNAVILVYERLVRGALKVKLLVLLVAVAILVGSTFVAIKNGTAFMPQMDSTQISADMKMPEGSLFDDTIAMSNEILKRVEGIGDVETVGAMLGSQGGFMGMGGSSVSTDSVSFYVILKEEKKNSSQEIAKQIEQLCEDLDCEFSASGSNMDMSAMGGSGISIQISGPELDTLKELATETAKVLGEVEGTQNVFDGMDNPTKEIRITVDKEKAMLKGLTVAQVYMEIQKEVENASAATQLSMEGSQYEILVSSDKKEAVSKEEIENFVFKIKNMEGKESNVKLKKIAAIEEDYSMSSIARSSQQRYITVTAELLDGYNIGIVSKDVEKAVDKVEIPNGYTLHYSGENETINEAMVQMVKMLLLAVVFIYLIMVAQFQSLLSPFIVMFTIPLAFTGGFIGLILTGNEVSIIAMLGFVMLSGIVVNNGIVLVDYINQLRIEGMEKKEAIVEAGMTRMRPIFMTALTTVLGLSTMAAGVGMGAEMMQPIAIVTIGGLLYATITTLFVIPVLYDLFNRREMHVIEEDELEIYTED